MRNKKLQQKNRNFFELIFLNVEKIEKSHEVPGFYL